MPPYSTCRYDDLNAFTELSSIIGVDLCRTRGAKWHQTWILQTVADRRPVMWVKEKSRFRRDPIEIRCRAFQGTCQTEWVGEGREPSFLRCLFSMIVSVFGVSHPYRWDDILRNAKDNTVIATYRNLHEDSLPAWRAEVVVRDNAYQLRGEPLSKGILYRGDRITVSGRDSEVATAIVDYTKPETGTITMNRLVEGGEAVLAFLFLAVLTRENETD